MSAPRILTGCSVLPPMEPAAPAEAERRDKAKGTPARRKAGERFAVLNAFADTTLATLDRAEIAVWLLLWRDTKPNGLARASQVDLARRAGVAERTVRRAIDGLSRAGLLDVVRRGGIGRGMSTYRVRPLDREK